ncbi:unnamed protein product [Vitrella brassicaformis CCMP3155]|uniref:Uncharacterized protein n=1 Tax=Vitrella brassicaformis (strain CCMP3155) TaxID=1169540 RepID=A0A0G4FB01_VITBC|nr:unnamed protein product [Vitrella brassicaformis CCMP3155]|eukprot:CEM10079.1 unnamed protein product [Vitrella brassicaformis CCMP3155]
MKLLLCLVGALLLAGAVGAPTPLLSKVAQESTAVTDPLTDDMAIPDNNLDTDGMLQAEDEDEDETLAPSLRSPSHGPPLPMYLSTALVNGLLLTAGALTDVPSGD